MKFKLRYTVILVLIAPLFMGNSGCDKEPTASQQEQAQLETQQLRLQKAIPVPQLRTSLERKNIARRLEWVNQDEAISYVYLVSFGRVMAYYTVRGKVSSLNSYMTAMEQVTRYGGASSSTEYVVTEAPDSDGTYGSNPEGIFFFTTEGVYVEWPGEYLWTSQPLKLSQPVELVQIVEPKKAVSTGESAPAVESSR